MAKDNNGDGVWNTGDAILFSINEAANFHGGELVHLPFGGTASFLYHGGHYWDPNFDPRVAFNIPLDKKKNADAVDSGRGESAFGIPTLSIWAMILMALLLLLTGIAVVRRQQRRIAA
ncbi:MAG: IPTL-CTERM sorting domain-containing protein [Candidatus Latescibacteria bacterium]|nr:IPTL-CTERM sorting domain-containing protein [Candidatus Latescibacterota bacterium]NIM22698.1 IPTL-CTERM sorting domain-containing protein [Candidatus Latescibacterota bacterium]NIM64987.1 IPTL-CTERM sorting domain-containing protein [Candidatus Latescibacterota bacterium]NIO01502.1 IPTL-CTERM sorting domain-containing protein [Candidatus Latescibacterota bacterium]NIO28011.1 IPTL-CTERM sorting domain-containing protein [Candidatus Latescibacterota bacterium]